MGVKFIRVHGRVVPVKTKSSEKAGSTKTSPKTWDALSKAGYVKELSDEQVAIAREKFNPTRPFSYAKNDHINGGIKSEKLMRAKFAKKKS